MSPAVGKGAQTRHQILDTALDLTSEVGIDGVTIGVLARLAGMSKSGLYAHFQSKEALQRAIFDHAAESFTNLVLLPAFREPRGLPRVRAIFENWLRWSREGFHGGCPFIAASSELDDRPGPVRDCLVGHLRDLTQSIEKAARIAVEEGHLRADLDISQVAYEMWANVGAHHHYSRLLRRDTADRRARLMFDACLERWSS